ncbi:CHAT domain-containing protein [Luedemannella helvata]|uniref:CHAT domain-containing protein n=1 Tax=Luedemannella helvata TaxID=349315 RepID=A0ABP4VXT2_9ACTN
MSRRPPRTSYGYLAPPGARVRGWQCDNDGCGSSDEPAPRSWPHPCRLCGRPTDAVFEEPWAHEARIYRIKHDMRASDAYRRELAQVEQHVWAYKDALLRDDRAAAGRAWQAYRAARPPRWKETGWWGASVTLTEMIWLTSRFGDLDQAVNEVLEWYPSVDTRDVENDNNRRTISRLFVSMCIYVLECESSIDHPREAEVHAAMRDIAARVEGVLMDHHHRGFQRIGELRAFHRTRAAIAAARRSAAVARDGLPPLSWPVARGETPGPPAQDDPRDVVRTLASNPRRGLRLVDAAIEAAQTHDDIRPLADLAHHLGTTRTCPSLAHLVRARLHVVTGELHAALRELEHASRADDLFAPHLRPQILATRALLLVHTHPDDLDGGIALCRAARQAGVRWWRRLTPADQSLARLLLRRASASETPAAVRFAADIREALRLMRRRCRVWRVHTADDRILLHEARAAHDALTGRRNDERRHRAWRDSVEDPWSTAGRARLAAAWAEWAVGTGVAEFAAEAYQQLVALAARDAIARQGAGARQRVLTAAQEYAEEAGYWLARTGRYREAALALETGRSVGLTGAGPIGLDMSYDDITAETGDGAIVYLAAAKAGGYALVVAARHDPQYVDLPKLDRAAVAGIVGRVLPEADASTGLARLVERDLAPPEQSRPRTDPMAEGLRTLWNDALRDLVLLHARGQVVTLVPIGLLNLLPLHAAGEPGHPGDEFTQWRHVGNFSAIRYAPNARGLRRCRDTARELAGRQPTLLAVDVPDGHGVSPAGHLRYVAVETAEVTRRWTGSATRPIHACTWEQFRAAADQHTVWHLACHGSAEAGSIMDSRLYFADRQVTLADLGRALQPAQRRLAVLSACRTNLTGSALPNEVVGLPSALIQIGFAGVIAASWAVDDLATTYLMTAFYQRWCRDGHEPAVALNRAQLWLRAATRADLTAFLPGLDPAGGPGEYPYVDPRYWAAFAYTGA